MKLLRIAFMVFLLIPVTGMGKKKHRLTKEDIVAASDSLLRQKIGDNLYSHCSIDNSAYYTYRKGKGVRFRDLLTGDKLHKRFQKAYIRYNFLMPYGECAVYDTISGAIDVELEKADTILVYTADPDTGFVPAMAAAHEPCKFISSEQAIDIARKDSLILGITAPYAKLHYQVATKTFSWVVLSLLWNEKDFDAVNEAKKDAVVIDAVSGDISAHKVVLYTVPVSDIYQK